ncbi:LLM class flavin-dependent oxidoreductase [Thalassospiraceae bacterium LMO-JJ14]|nr:LLM class flavin-dependent oxidoreductase [Thalassospiraceae bacterium LMO-JJ14]
MVALSVLDQSTAAAGVPQAQAIRDTVALAKYCEDLGYKRFWVSEHHNHPTIVGSAPEIVMAAIAQTTARIRIGSAGIMLPHYASLKVAEQFRVLDALAPGRIDLGLGRAPGSDGKTAFALNPNAHEDAEHFPANVRDLMAWVTGEPLIAGHPFNGLVAQPQGETAPEMWMLGTSDYGARVAAHFGMPYCFAHFITDGRGVERAFQVYRDNYQPSERYPDPIANVCVWALAAETDADAERLFTSRAHWKVRREMGDLLPIQSPDSIEGFEYTQGEKARIAELRAGAIIGTGQSVYQQLETLAGKLGIDEAVVLTWTHAQEDRRNSYRLLAEAK